MNPRVKPHYRTTFRFQWRDHQGHESTVSGESMYAMADLAGAMNIAKRPWRILKQKDGRITADVVAFSQHRYNPWYGEGRS